MSFQTKKFNSILASMINWASGVTDRVTDYNVGSVIRTIFEAVAAELEELYYQLLKAVEEAIEEAIYRTFNFSRNPANKATGAVRFFRLVGGETQLVVPRGTTVGTDSNPSVLFETTADGIIQIFTGTATGGSTSTLMDTSRNFLTDGVQILSGSTAGAKIINVTKSNSTSDAAGIVSITTTSSSGDTLSFSNLVNGKVFEVGDEYLLINNYVDISVRALVSGSGSNVIANSIISLRSNVSGVSGVTNPSAFSTGREEESDSERKARFALYIQSLARATKGALEYAARTVPEIISSRAIDDVRPNVLKFNPLIASTEDQYDDITSGMRNPGDRPLDLLINAGVGEMMYVGAKEVFDWINFHLFTEGAVSGDAAGKLRWEYSTATEIWGDLTNSILSPSGDSTIAGDNASLTQSGTLAFDPPDDWVAKLVHNQLRLWIRLVVTETGAGVYTTIPSGDYISLPPGLGYVYLYAHDGSGDLNSTLKASVEAAVEPYRGCGIIVEVKAPQVVTQDIHMDVYIAANYDTTLMSEYIAQRIKDWVNSKALGDDLYVADLYQFVMDLNDAAIVNSKVNLPASDIVLSSSQILRELGGDLVTTTTAEGKVITTLGSIEITAINVA